MNWLKLTTILITLALTACSSYKPSEVTPPRPKDLAIIDSTPGSAESLIKRAEKAYYPEKGRLLLQAVDKLLAQHDIERAKLIISSIPLEEMDTSSAIHLRLINAAFAIHNFEPDSAKYWLNSLDIHQLPPAQKISYHELMAYMHTMEHEYLKAIKNWNTAATPAFLSEKNKTKLYDKLWDTLMTMSLDNLMDLAITKEQHPNERPWIDLALIFKSSTEIKTQISEINQWLSRWQQHPAVQHLPQDIRVLLDSTPYQPQKIALILPLEGPLGSAGKAVRDGFIAAYLHSHQTSTQSSAPEILIYDSSANSPQALVAKAEADGVGIIIGPLSRSAVEQTLIETRSQIPQLFLNTPASNTSSKRHSDYAYFISLSAELEAIQAAERAWNDGYRHPIVITPKSDWGDRIKTAFQEQWQALGGEVLDSLSYDGNDHPNTIAAQILQVDQSQKRHKELKNVLGKNVEQNIRRRQDLDMFFMAATPTTGRQLKPSLNYYYAYDIPVYSTSSIFEGSSNLSKDRDLNGIRFPSIPWHFNKNSTLIDKITNLWKNSSGQFASLYALGVDTWHLYPRLEQLSRSPGAQMPGETGQISIDSQGNIHRQLSWQYFRNGTPRALTRDISRKREENTTDGMASNN